MPRPPRDLDPGLDYLGALGNPWTSSAPPNRTTSPTPRGGGRWYNEWDIREHQGDGRLLHQYATQPKPSHRICRGRP